MNPIRSAVLYDCRTGVCGGQACGTGGGAAPLPSRFLTLTLSFARPSNCVVPEAI